ncbi:hypothetical protein L6452_35840 [Arctium lappa]|uniref:Uncharacterized protein n=1 Tax=Arctium lappa TaxID=4217 RepID=A0ACB8Y8S3_ARCLA|nr:hypothetical protein L6452_35840 [Arctium lappa]
MAKPPTLDGYSKAEALTGSIWNLSSSHKFHVYMQPQPQLLRLTQRFSGSVSSLPFQEEKYGTRREAVEGEVREEVRKHGL